MQAFEIGHNNEATGESAVAVGFDNVAAADRSVTIGSASCLAVADGCIVCGWEADCTRPGGIALGQNAHAGSGVTVGKGASGTGGGSVVLGVGASNVGAAAAVVLGHAATGNGTHCLAFGRSTHIEGEESIGIGSYIDDEGHDRTIALGKNARPQNDNEMVVGSSADPASRIDHFRLGPNVFVVPAIKTGLAPGAETPLFEFDLAPDEAVGFEMTVHAVARYIDGHAATYAAKLLATIVNDSGTVDATVEEISAIEAPGGNGFMATFDVSFGGSGKSTVSIKPQVSKETIDISVRYQLTNPSVHAHLAPAIL